MTPPLHSPRTSRDWAVCDDDEEEEEEGGMVAVGSRGRWSLTATPFPLRLWFAGEPAALRRWRFVLHARFGRVQIQTAVLNVLVDLLCCLQESVLHVLTSVTANTRLSSINLQELNALIIGVRCRHSIWDFVDNDIRWYFGRVCFCAGLGLSWTADWLMSGLYCLGFREIYMDGSIMRTCYENLYCILEHTLRQRLWKGWNNSRFRAGLQEQQTCECKHTDEDQDSKQLRITRHRLHLPFSSANCLASSYVTSRWASRSALFPMSIITCTNTQETSLWEPNHLNVWQAQALTMCSGWLLRYC